MFRNISVASLRRTGIPRPRTSQRALVHSTRFTSTNAPSGFRKYTPLVAAGVAGGVTVILGGKSIPHWDTSRQDRLTPPQGYAWYHFSGVKNTVDTAVALKNRFFSTQKSVAESASKQSNVAIEYLRKTTKAYVGFLPGASPVVDTVFDTLDEVHDKHREEVDKIVAEGYDELQGVIRESDGAPNLLTGTRVLGVIKKIGVALAGVGRRAGQSAFITLKERHPLIADQLESGYQVLLELAMRSGPEGARIFEETMQQVCIN